MVMPPCGTFRYAGIVPPEPSTRWRLSNQESIEAEHHGPLFANRLVGLNPTVKISGDWITLKASKRHRAQVSSVAFRLDSHFLQLFRSGDVLNVVRTATADIGLSITRLGNLVAAVGAATQVPLGEDISVRGGSDGDPWQHQLRHFRHIDTWLDVSVQHLTSRLRKGHQKAIGNYHV